MPSSRGRSISVSQSPKTVPIASIRVDTSERSTVLSITDRRDR
jgi:hypothetical protein